MKQQLKLRAKAPPIYGEEIFVKEIESNLQLKNPLIEELLLILAKHDFMDEDERVWAQLCIDELLVNAIKHGNKEDKVKKVKISLFIDKNQWAIRVEDEGEGFKVEEILDTTSQEFLEEEHGRGILIMKNYMDEIWYYDKGNRVQLKKLKKTRLQKMLSKILVFLKLQ